MKSIEVAAGVLKNSNGQYFISLRERSRLYGFEFAGGKLEKGESPAQAVEREFKEEFLADIIVDQPLGEVYYTYQDGLSVHIHVFLAHLLENSEIIPQETSSVKWAYLEEMDQYDFLAADKMIVEMLKEKIGEGQP